MLMNGLIKSAFILEHESREWVKDEETKSQRVKETKSQRDKEMKRLREEEIKSRREEETNQESPLR